MTKRIVSEEEFLDATGKIISRIADGYKFGIYQKQDIAQEIRLLAWEAMSRYDGEHALYQFLLIHVTNRLNTLKRDKWYRATCPCDLCDKKEEGQTGHRNGQYCKQFLKWKKRNASKANLAYPPSIPTNFDKEEEDCSFDTIELAEISDKIDSDLPVSLRGIYLRMKSGVRVSEVEKSQLLVYLKEMFNEA